MDVVAMDINDKCAMLIGLYRMMCLRAMLKEVGIEWWDDTDIDMDITRTKFEYGGREHSVIFGLISYGHEQGLLEYWDYDKEEPEGYLTEEEIMEKLKNNNELKESD